VFRLAKTLPALLLLTCALCVSEARADTFVVTSGSASVSLFGGSFSFNGDGMSLAGSLSNGPFTTFLQPGQPLSLLTRNVGGDIRSGSGVVGGVAHPQFFYTGTMDFNAVLPPLSFTEGAFSVVVPFDLTGRIQGCLNNANVEGPCHAGYLFDTFLTGQGMATVELIGFALAGGGQGFQIRGVTYNFGSPVPEPATLLLLTTGLAGVAAAARRRRQRGGR
jgi:PEP-CTERM motif